MPGHLRPSSVIIQQVLPSSHRRLACVPGHLRPSSTSCSPPLFSSPPVWTSQRCPQPRGPALRWPPWPAKHPSGSAQQLSRGVNSSVISPPEHPAHCCRRLSGIRPSPPSTLWPIRASGPPSDSCQPAGCGQGCLQTSPAGPEIVSSASGPR